MNDALDECEVYDGERGLRQTIMIPFIFLINGSNGNMLVLWRRDDSDMIEWEHEEVSGSVCCSVK